MHAWSTQQNAIFTHFRVAPRCPRTGKKKNLVVRARAGTGKTTTIVEALHHCAEQKILVAAFNKEIARELTAKIGDDARIQVKTLHSLGFAFLRTAWRNVSVESDTCSGERARGLALRAAPNAPDNILRLIANLHSKVREIDPLVRNVVGVEEVAYRFDLLPDAEEKIWTVGKVCQAAYQAVMYAKERVVAIDFPDMVFLPLVHGLVRPWFDMVVVDECQDMTDAMLLIAMGACKRDGRLVLVGDNRQAIYGFRGADSGSLDRLKVELDADELGLTITYRCPQLIVALAQTLVPDYTAALTAPLGVINYVSKEQMLAGVRAGDFVISRTNAELVEVCMLLLKMGVRATIRGRDIGKGILALVRKMRAGSPAELMSKLDAWRSGEVARATALGEKGESRIQFVTDQFELIVALSEGIVAVKELEDRVYNLFSDGDPQGKVICTSVHKVKGQETNNTWLLEGTFRKPSGEEANIRYVAITRAKQQLNWVAGFEKKKAA